LLHRCVPFKSNFRNKKIALKKKESAGKRARVILYILSDLICLRNWVQNIFTSSGFGYGLALKDLHELVFRGKEGDLHERKFEPLIFRPTEKTYNAGNASFAANYPLKASGGGNWH